MGGLVYGWQVVTWHARVRLKMEVAFSRTIGCCLRSIHSPLLIAGGTRTPLLFASYSTPPNAGDRGPDKNYKKKMKKEKRKRTGVNTNLLIDVLKQFEEEASVEARTKSDMEDKELG